MCIFGRAVAFVSALMPPLVRANSVWDAVESGHLYVTRGGVTSWEASGVSTNWLACGDLVITFTNLTGNTSTESTLHLPGYSKVWALAVGGGGAGGDYGNMTSMGAGGGGGAGGYSEIKSTMLAGGEAEEGDYTISVGAGGPKRTSGTKGCGQSGNNSSLAFSGATPSDVLTAVGGGGGGGVKVTATAGGSGGGGNYYSNTARDGGAGTTGQGNAGGRGAYKTTAGGGGGAGSAGSPGSSATVSGNGGTAKSSSITGVDVWYAGGGGGGARATGTLGLGGGTSTESKKGGGGNGGNGSNQPQNGVDGLGGGGGGAGSSTYGGKGGDGVVIIRISMVVDGPIEKPEDNQELPYNGEEQTVEESIPGVYTITGQNKATNVSVTPYEYTATLEPGLQWSDGTDAPVVNHWSIVAGQVEVPEKKFDTVAYDGQAHVVVEAVPKMHFTSGSQTNETNVGDYSYTIELDDKVNYRWSNTSLSDNQTFNWSIAPRQVAPQPLPTGLVYSGTNNVAATNSAYYTFAEGSTVAATDAGNYYVEYVLTDPANNRWTDGSVTNLIYTWSIAPQKIGTQPMPEGLVYSGTNNVAATNSSYYTFAEGSTTCATNAGDYHVEFVLKNSNNYHWLDDSVTNQTFFWSIARLPVARPPLPGDNGKFVYDGKWHTAATNSVYYEFGEGSTVQARDVKSYFVDCVLNGNWCWNEEPTLETYRISWSITKAPNKITSLTIGDWKLGETAKTPQVKALFGEKTVVYTYGTTAQAKEGWSEPPNTNGSFYVRAVIPETTNYSSAEKSTKFLIYKSFDEIYTDYVDINPNYTGSEILYNQPVLIKISETIYPGFTYARCNGGENLAFMNAPGTANEIPLSFEIDTWNESGESFVWVKVPKLRSDTTFRMYWHLQDGKEGPGPSPSDVWGDYVGVWHFSEKIASSAAAATVSADSTGNAYDAVPKQGGGGQLSDMTSFESGMIGRARYNGNTVGKTSKGNYLSVTNFAECALGTNFVFSGWIKFSGYASGEEPWILARKVKDASGGFAVSLDSGTNHNKLQLYGSNTTAVTTGAIASQQLSQGWEFLTLAISGKSYWLATHSPTMGSYTVSGALASSVGEDALSLAFGNDISGTTASVRGIFDEFRLRTWDPSSESTETLSKEAQIAYDTVQNSGTFLSHGWILCEGMKQNYWKTRPSLSKTTWDEGESVTLVTGEPATGTVQVVYRNVFKPDEELPATLPTTAGNYTVTFTVEVEGFDPLVEQITFTIVGHSPYSILGVTEEGRTLLANDDSRGNWGDTAITNQAYWQTQIVNERCSSYTVKTNRNPVTHKIISVVTNWVYWTITSTNSTFWAHSGETTPEMDYSRPYLLTNSIHTLSTTNKIAALCGASVLWHLNQICIGNLYGESLSESSVRNYLPWSSTSCAISSNRAVFSKCEIGNLMMRNTLDAAIYSPCYTNGIGTIYFDAVNFWANDPADYYHLQVQVATNVLGSSAIPTDENVHEIIVTTNNLEEVIASGAEPEISVTTNLYARADWHAVSVVPHKFIGSACTAESATTEPVLHITDGGTHANFYRLVAQLNLAQPSRFRIKRVEYDEAHSGEPDDYAQILLDNVIVSNPREWGEVVPEGLYDTAKCGKQVLGYENTWSVPFPSINDAAVCARGVPIYHLLPGSDTATSEIITKTTMFYRERYLSQRVEEPFKSVVLNPYDDFTAMSSLVFSGLVGDVEFYFVSDLQAKYYQYVDYAAAPGEGLGIPGFTEELACYTNRCTTLSSSASPTLGTDWFVRLREGKSDIEQMVLRTDQAQSEIQMELISDHIWRGYFKTLDAVSAGVRYRIEPRNWQTPGERGFVVTNAYWYAPSDVDTMPVSAILNTDGTTNSWAKIPCDATTGYLMFQVDDSTKSISVVHADYQNFDFWDDAKSVGSTETFIGCSTNDSKKAGVSAKKQEFKEDFIWRGGAWTNTPSESAAWTETFNSSESSEKYPDYTPFASTTTKNGWQLGAGMYIYQWYRNGAAKESSGVVAHALQMEGCGKGWIQFPSVSSFTTTTPAPRGLGTVSFKARLGQFIEANDLSFAEFPLDDTDVSSDYVFATMAAFDRNSNKDFSGDASLSLFAYYRFRRGAYEVRLEQIGGDSSGPGDKGKRAFSLYRWTRQTDGSVKAILLGAKTNEFANIKTVGENGNYMPMYISCQNESSATVIKFGFQCKDSSGTEGQGYPGLTCLTNNLSKQQFYSLVYRDTSDDRLKAGTYGVLSANCPAYFHQPFVSHSPISTSKSDKNKLVEDGTSNTVTFPKMYSCRHDLLKDDTKPWNVNEGRMMAFESEKSGAYEQHVWGIRSAPVEQTVVLEVRPRGDEKEGSWVAAESYTFNDFGSQGSSGELHAHRFDRTTDYDVRLRVEGELDDVRTDIVVDDIKVTQWRACDYGDIPDTSSFMKPQAPGTTTGWATNFIFTSGWVTNGAVRLSPKRTAGYTTGSTACAIRSPLMDGKNNRGSGLGMISFSYRRAQPNASLFVQIATNGVTASRINSFNTIDDSLWTTVSNVNFSAMTAAQRASGRVDVYLGLHGITGLMRVVADPSVVSAVSGTDYLDESLYGEVDVTGIYCRDEPSVDLTAWWGFNLQTTDKDERQYLVDRGARQPTGANGLSLGLNRGINPLTDGVADDSDFQHQMPFVQTPTFVKNEVGEITFRARKYDLDQTSNSVVVLYGGTYRSGTQDLEWHCSSVDTPLATFVISNTTYATYTYKSKPGEGYKAFRLGVGGIKEVDAIARGKGVPIRALIDEVLVSEAIRPKIGFKYCTPIRNGMATAAAVPTAGDRDEQPIMGDAWSVQAEIEVKLLPDEVDLTTHKPKVYFHWFCGESPWGYSQWRDNAKANTAELALAEDEEMIFRGSYITCPKAVVMAEPSTATYSYRLYQFAAEVVYYDTKGNCLTNVLDETEWTRPEWYAPLDLNAANAGTDEDAPFAAYNILERIAPGRAWINEANVFDGRTASFEYPAENNQYVEIAAPLSQSLDGWRLSYIDNNIQTNLLCIFGQGGVAETKTANATNNFVFVTVQSRGTATAATLDASKGEVDGTWLKFDSSDSKAELDQTHPIGFILARPSGIVAHEIVMEGTNTWAGTAYAERYSAARRVETLNAADPEQQWYSVGNEYGGTLTTSLGVTNVVVGSARASAVAPAESWTSRGTKTPGKCNDGEIIPEGYAIYPSGDMVIVNATIVGSHIRQTVGDVTNAIASAMIATPKNGDGTNILYNVDTWYEIAEIRENNVLKQSGRPDGYVYTAAKDSEESVITVTATARPRSDLREKYGLTDSNPYTDAVLSWLEGGETLKGPFANPGNIDLPKFRNYAGNFITNLTLTETYWFDIDPTGSNWCYRAGNAVQPYEYDYTTASGVTKTNVRIGVFMLITNEVSGANWSPYVLRGKLPGAHSQQYAAGLTNSWDSVNFKFTADMLEGLPLRKRWVPLRYFVFKEGSFDAHHISTIDMPHPFSPDSLAVNYGWHEVKDTYKGVIGYRWSVDGRTAPVAIEVLCPTNAITW